MPSPQACKFLAWHAWRFSVSAPLSRGAGVLPLETVLFLVTGAALAGFVMGLVGFGTGLAALGFWLFVVDPVLADLG